MTFFERQAAARRASPRLWLLFAFAVLGIMVAVDLAVWIVLAVREDVSRMQVLATMAFVSAATLALIGFGASYRVAALRDGGESIAQRIGGVPVPAQTRDPHLRRLRRLVETLAVASGMPMPKLYVLERESAINAFAAGHAPSDAVVAVTRGALDRLGRDELQGVVAHAFGRILDGDLRGDIRLLGALSGILAPALAGQRILEDGHQRPAGRGIRVVLGSMAMLCGGGGRVFGRLIKAGESRPRALHADASAVRCVAKSAGLAGALKKIAALEEGATLSRASDAEEIGHLLFDDGVGLRGPFATHPPPLERIQALEPGFGGHQLARLREQWRAAPPNGLEEDARLTSGDAGAAALPAPTVRMPLTPAMVAAQVARPGAESVSCAEAILAHLPDALCALANDRERAATLALALLLDDDADVRRRQHAEIAARLGRDTAVMAQALRDEQLPALHAMQRLPLATQAFPTLHLRPHADLSLILDTLQAAINADGRVRMFEWALGTLLHTQLREAMNPSLHGGSWGAPASASQQEIALLLSLVALNAHDDRAQAERAYLAGLQRALPRDHIAFAPPARGVLALDAAWPTLDALDPPSKRLLVEGLAAAIAIDGAVGVREAELLRAVCGALHCPLPPFPFATG